MKTDDINTIANENDLKENNEMIINFRWCRCLCVVLHYFSVAFNVLFQVKKLIDNVGLAAGKSGIAVEEPGVSQPLPPSSFHRFLRARSIPGLVIEDHHFAFTNRWLMAFWKDTLEIITCFWIEVLRSVFRFYGSMYDNAEYLNVSYPSNMTQEEQLDFLTDTAKVL